ncbi:MAG: type II secretion system protein [Patescibacteria group bacterium]|mgnify:CR=1 FL=1
MKKRSGLTLIELLIVISVLSILLAMLLPNFNDVRKQARDRRRKADVRAIQQALELYRSNQTPQSYPTGSLPNSGSIWTEGGVVYMKKMPEDPLYDINNAQYYYRYTQVASDTYFLGACLENIADNDIAPSPAAGWGTCESSDGNATPLFYYMTEP